MNGTARAPLAVVLAGGEGTRMGGRKAFVDLCGRPLIAHVIDRLAPQVSRIAINAGDDPGFAAFGLPLVPDAEPGLGPLGGILAALRWAQDEGSTAVLTAAVDTPFLPVDLAERLAAVGARSAYAETARGPHATTGLWSVDLAASLEQALASGTRRVRDWTRAIGAVPVRFGDEAAFFNVNTPDDLRVAEERLAT